MKNLIFIISILITTFGFSQSEYEIYTMDLLAEKKGDYKIELSEKKDELKFWIEPAPLDRLYDVVSIPIEEKELTEFVEVLKKYEQKFSEWKAIAIENDVNEIKELMDIPYRVDKVFFNTGSSDWHIARKVKIEAWMMDFDENISLVIKNKHKLQSGSNQFTECDGFYLIFKDSDEINEFISKFEINKAKEFMNEEKKKKKLFN